MYAAINDVRARSTVTPAKVDASKGRTPNKYFERTPVLKPAPMPPTQMPAKVRMKLEHHGSIAIEDPNVVLASPACSELFHSPKTASGVHQLVPKRNLQVAVGIAE